MPTVGDLEAPAVPGEARGRDPRGEIEAPGIAWQVAQAAAAGSGRRQPHADVGPITVDEFHDAAADDHFDDLRITLCNCLVTRCELLPPEPGEERPGLPSRRRRADAEPVRERISLDFEHIRILYTGQNRDGSAGPEHEVDGRRRRRMTRR